MTFIYLDVETTGLDPKNNSIIQLSGMFKSGTNEETFDFRIAPYHNERMSAIAAEKTGISTSQAYSFEDQKSVFEKFSSLCQKYVKSYNEKAYLIGYNVSFDDSFMREWFSLNNAKWGYVVWFPYIDVMTLAGLRTIGARPLLKNFQLSTVYNYFTGKSLDNAHDAMADIVATKEIFEILAKDLMLKPKAFLDIEQESNSDEIPF